MYCPKCGAHNVEHAKFCRACGADISLVPQALARTLPEGAFGVLEIEEQEADGNKGRKYKFKEPPTFDKGLSKIFTGFAFMLIVLLGYFYFFGGVFIWVWFIIPALSNFGEGIGQIIQARMDAHALPAPPQSAAAGLHAAPPPRAGLPAPRDTSEIAAAPPPSVTEGTTRHLDPAKN